MASRFKGGEQMTRPEFIHFVVPGNPVPWERARTHKGRYYTPARTRAYQQAVQLCAKNAKAKAHAGVKVRLCLTFFRKDHQPCDIDNLAKTVQDALQGIAYENDRQIAVLTAVRDYDAANPRAEVLVEYLAEGGGGWQAAEAAEDDYRDFVLERFGT